MPFDHTTQPEFQGPVTEPRAAGMAAALDIQALAQHSIRLPRLDPAAQAAGELVPLRGFDPYHDPALIAREREQAALTRDTGREALRTMFEGAARGAGADWLTARRTADALMNQVPAPEPPPDPGPDAIEATLAAEAEADAGKTALADALDLT